MGSEVSDQCLDGCPHLRRDIVPCGALRVVQRCGEIVLDGVQDGDENRFLAFEIYVEGADRTSRCFHNHRDTRLVEAVLSELVTGDVNQEVAAGAPAGKSPVSRSIDHEQEKNDTSFCYCQGPNRRVDRRKGTGIGLWVVRNIVDDLGGTITLESSTVPGHCGSRVLTNAAGKRDSNDTPTPFGSCRDLSHTAMTTSSGSGMVRPSARPIERYPFPPELPGGFS